MVLIDRLLTALTIGSAAVLIGLLLVVATLELVFGVLRDLLTTRLTARFGLHAGEKVWWRLLLAENSVSQQWRPSGVTEQVASLPSIHAGRFSIKSAAYVTLPVCLVSIAAMAWINLLLSATFLAGVIILAAGAAKTSRSRRAAISQVTDSGMAYRSAAVEVLRNHETLQALGARAFGFNRIWSQLRKSSIDAFELSRRTASLSRISAFLQDSLAALTLLVAAVLVLTNRASLGELIAFDMLANQIRFRLTTSVNAWTSWQTSSTAEANLRELLTSIPKGAYVTANPIRKAQLEQPVHYAASGFRFEPDTPPILTALDLKLAPGDRVAISGPSGTGKSTLGRLLTGNLAASQMALSFGGRVRRDPIRCLRESTMYLPQTPALFAGSVLENILLTPLELASEQEIADAIAAALSIGLGELVGTDEGLKHRTLLEGGANLSGGQRQRVHLARALVRLTPVLVLDEPTSALDSVTASRVLHLLGEKYSSAAVVVMSHDPSVWEWATRHYKLEGGELHESRALTGGTRPYDLFDEDSFSVGSRESSRRSQRGRHT